jgi:hypothetical protein
VGAVDDVEEDLAEDEEQGVAPLPRLRRAWESGGAPSANLLPSGRINHCDLVRPPLKCESGREFLIRLRIEKNS